MVYDGSMKASEAIALILLRVFGILSRKDIRKHLMISNTIKL